MLTQEMLHLLLASWVHTQVLETETIFAMHGQVFDGVLQPGESG